MIRKKNLSKFDLEEVNTWEDQQENYKITQKLDNIKIKIKCANEKQKLLKKAIEEHEIVISIGPAGTGKTYISLITALHLIKTESYRKLVLIKSIQHIEGENPGFLPGTLKEKMEPYMCSYTGNLNKMVGGKHITEELFKSDQIIIEPIAYIRGNTIDNCMLPGTKIILSNGESMEIEELYKKFNNDLDEDIKLMVKSFNFKTNTIEDKELSMIAKNPIINDDLYEIELKDGRLIKLTGNHRLHVKNKGFIEVKDIEETDELTHM